MKARGLCYRKRSVDIWTKLAALTPAMTSCPEEQSYKVQRVSFDYRVLHIKEGDCLQKHILFWTPCLTSEWPCISYIALHTLKLGKMARRSSLRRNKPANQPFAGHIKLYASLSLLLPGNLDSQGHFFPTIEKEHESRKRGEKARIHHAITLFSRINATCCRRIFVKTNYFVLWLIFFIVD